MKKAIIIAMLLSLVSVQQIYAQKWLKTLGKAAENMLTNDQKTNQKATTKASGSIPGCTIKFTSCVPNGDNVHINFVITNTTSSELKMHFNAFDGGSYAFDSKNVKHKIHFYLSGEKLGNYSDRNIPSNVPVKGIMVVENVDRTIKQINNAVIKGKSNDVEFAIAVPTQVVADIKNTNSDLLTCSLPELQFNFLKCVRQGKNVVITATFKNTSNMEYEVSAYGNTPTIYDDSGDSYQCDDEATRLGNNRWLGYNFYTLLAGIPMKATFVIQNVSTGATEFSIVKIPFKHKANDETMQYIEFRNLPISAQ